MSEKIQQGNRFYLYDDTVNDKVVESSWITDLFDTDIPNEHKIAQGRADAIFFDLDGATMVRKHYHRGGMIASCLGDRYFGSDPDNSRAFREFRLLGQLISKGLPVPRPIAARTTISGIFNRSDLVTEAIMNTQTLADRCMAEPLPVERWKQIGSVIRKFHDQKVFHADLNARNILIDDAGEIYLLDFDKGELRNHSSSWKESNLKRLRRSLDKFKKKTDRFYFEEDDWSVLLSGYS